MDGLEHYDEHLHLLGLGLGHEGNPELDKMVEEMLFNAWGDHIDIKATRKAHSELSALLRQEIK